MVGRATVEHGARHWPHVVAGATAFALGDLILGFAAFSSITLASLWYFSWEWIQLRAEYLAHGLAFGSTWQLGLAWFAVLAAFPLLVLTVFLAVRALTLPRRVYHIVRNRIAPAPSPDRYARSSDSAARRGSYHPNYVASFWSGSP